VQKTHLVRELSEMTVTVPASHGGAICLLRLLRKILALRVRTYEKDGSGWGSRSVD
jgi:hypothetical protein